MKKVSYLFRSRRVSLEFFLCVAGDILLIAADIVPFGSVSFPPYCVAMYTGGIRGAMITVYKPAAVGAIVAVFHWPVLRVFVGVCVTVAPVPMFSVASAGGCVVPFIVIVLLSNG